MPALQAIDAAHYEVIVTDDGSDEATADLVKAAFPWVRYTYGPRRGPAANRNHGASLASGQWLVFTDDDCLPDANWLQAYHDAITGHPDCRAFEGAILPDDWKLLQKDLAECPVNTAGGCFWSANIMVERQLFQSMGGFDEQFLIAAQEDQDLQWRIQQQHSIVFVPAAQMVHPVRWQKFFFWEKNKFKRLLSFVIKNKKQNKKNFSIVKLSMGSLIHAIWNAIRSKKLLYACHLVLHFCYQCVMFPIVFWKVDFEPKV